MVWFDLARFLIDKRINVQELGKKFNMCDKTIYAARSAGRIKIEFLRQLENAYGDCSQYIQF